MKRLYVFPLFLIATLLCSIPLSAHDFEVDGIYYKITGLYKTNVAVSFKGDYFDSYPNEYSGSVTIPETVTYAGNTYSVTSIGEGAFRGCSDLTSVSLASTINSIDGYAFSDCFSLSEINITDSVTYIGGFAFSDCFSLSEINIPNSITSIFSGTFLRSGLTSITIPNSVTNIGGGAFQDTDLTEINIPNSVTSIGGGAFLGCSGLTDITIPNSVTSIEQGAFQDTGWYNNQLDGVLYLDNCCLGLKSEGGLGHPIITIKDGTRLIAEHAFDGCIFTSITIPSSVTNIGKNVFYNCNLLKSIVVESGNSVYDSRDNCNAIIETATNTLIAGCKRTIIPNSVTSIGYRAFWGCTGLTEITIPNSVTSIGEEAFWYCSNLAEVNISNSVTSIGRRAFQYTGLTEITIPNSVTHIGENSFAKTFWYDNQPDGVLYIDNCCLGYKGELIGDLTLTEGTRLIAEHAFSREKGLASVTIPNSVKNIGAYAFSGCDSLTYVSIGSSVTSFGNQFRYCNIKELRFEDSSTVLEISANEIQYHDEIETLYLGRNVSANGHSAFSSKKSLKNVIIGDSVTSIGANAFEMCDGLTSVTIGSSVTSIGSQAFWHCFSLTSITIPNSVKSIGSYAFIGCDSLAYVSIGRSVRSIGNSAFSNCKNLKELRFEASSTVLDISNSHLNYNNIIETLYLGRNIIGSFSNIETLKNVTIGNSVTNINNISNRCSGLTSIVVKSGNIVYDSRDNCNAIIETATNTLIAGCKRTIIPNSVKSIGSYAFRDCSGLTSITIPNSVTSIGERAFYECTGLTSVSIGNSVTSIGKEAFYSCDNIKELRFEDSSIELDISNSYLNYNNIIESLYLGRNIIGSFSNIETLKNVTIGNSVTNINNISNRCSGLTSIVVKSGNIVYDSRDNCNAIIETATNTLIAGCKRTIIPNSVTSIGYRAFLECTGLTEINIPNSVTNIGERAFFGCNNLTKITIGNSVTSIGEEAFFYCHYLELIRVLNSIPPKCYYNTFTNYNSLLEVPAGSLVAYRQADVWCNFTNITEVSGIEDVKVDATDIQELGRYDIDGRLLTEPTPGVNIIKMSDGSTRKEWVK